MANIWKNKVRVKSQVERARRRRRARIIITSTAILVLLVAGLITANLNKFLIHDIVLENQTSIDDEILFSMVEEKISGRHFLLVPRKSFLFVPVQKISSAIKQSSFEVDSVIVKRKNLNTLSVEVSKRVPYALWCGEFSTEERCFFADKNALIFLRASDFSKNFFPIFKSSISGNILGKGFISPEDFRNSLSLVSFLKDSNLNVSHIEVTKESFRLRLASGADIIFDPSEARQVAQNINALLESDNIQSEGFDFLNIDYVDMRYGNKVFWKPN